MSRADRQERKEIQQQLAATAARLESAPTPAAAQQVLRDVGIDDLADNQIPAFTDHLRAQSKKG